MQITVNISSTIRLFSILILLALAACTRIWYLSIEENGGNNPILCFSSMKHCAGDGVQFYSLAISEINDKGEEVQLMWSIQAKTDQHKDNVLKQVTYGITPIGWVDLQAAKEIRTDTYYGVDGKYYFIKVVNEEYQVYEREAFFKKLHLAL